MLMSVSNAIYDLILEQMNQNTKGVIFDGNWTLRFFQNDHNKFEIIEKGDALTYDLKEVVPFVDVSTIEIPYNEKNKRSDYELEYYVSMRIPKQYDTNNDIKIAFDYTCKEYQALMEVYEHFKEELTFTHERENQQDIKGSFKVREPQKVNIFKYGGDYYVVFAFVVTVSTIKFGMFGNETKVYMSENTTNDNDLLDTLEFSSIVGKGEQNISGYDEQHSYFNIEKTTWEFNATINYEEKDIVKELYKEAMADTAENNVKYHIRIKREGFFDIERIVRVTSANVAHISNVPVTITFSVKLAEV